ncbi:MAG: YceH family protein [Bacteroidota bacterium]
MESENNLPVLDSTEIRVLGALIEKAMTTPDYYPMTLNGLTTACNQKTSRKPVVEYDEETVVLALNTLKRRGLVSTETGGTSRSVKYQHTFAIAYRTDPAELTVIGLLLLRGPQTPGELKSNSGRMYEFDTLEEVQQTLDALSSGETPFIQQLPRKAGQKEQRFMHLFAGELPEDDEELPQEPARKTVGELEGRVARLEQELAELKERFETLYKELM